MKRKGLSPFYSVQNEITVRNKMRVVGLILKQRTQRRKERRDFVISTIYFVSIARFCCCVKCNSVTLKG